MKLFFAVLRLGGAATLGYVLAVNCPFQWMALGLVAFGAALIGVVGGAWEDCKEE